MAFTGKLTEEEQVLQKKFVLLKKKRIELQQKKRHKPQQPTPQPAVKRAAEPANQEEAKEIAKKVLAAQADKFRSENKGSGFKRSRHLERRLQNPDKAPAFQPFSSSGPGASGESEEKTRSPAAESNKGHYKSLYSNFVSGGIAKSSEDFKETRNIDPSDRFQNREKKRGNTIYVHGHGITHDLCDKAFKKFGTLANISVEKGKNTAFVTFDKIEAAESAILEMNGNMVGGATLRVSMARRQPILEAATDMNSPWTGLATGLSKGPRHKDSRSAIIYDDNIFGVFSPSAS